MHTETCKGDDLLLTQHTQSRRTIHIHQCARQALAQTGSLLDCVGDNSFWVRGQSVSGIWRFVSMLASQRLHLLCTQSFLTLCTHPPARLKHHLVSQNILSKKAAPQMAASMGHFKLVGSYRSRRRLQYQKAVVESSSKSHRSFRLNPCLSMYTDTALTSLDSTLRAIHCFHLLHDERFHYVQIKFL